MFTISITHSHSLIHSLTRSLARSLSIIHMFLLVFTIRKKVFCLLNHISRVCLLFESYIYICICVCVCVWLCVSCVFFFEWEKEPSAHHLLQSMSIFAHLSRICSLFSIRLSPSVHDFLFKNYLTCSIVCRCISITPKFLFHFDNQSQSNRTWLFDAGLFWHMWTVLIIFFVWISFIIH